MFLKVCIWSVKSINNLKGIGQKQFKKKTLNTFFFSREEGQWKGMNLVGGFAVFKLFVVLSIIKLYMHAIVSSDICNFLMTGILICNSNSNFHF